MGQLEDILKHQNMVRNNIMKSFGAETSEDSLEKSFEDEVNPFEMEAYKSELTKAELDEFEKAKHQDGDMHPNGKWVWRASANGGKGDWRVAKKGSSSTSGGSGSAGNTGPSNASSSYFSKLSNSLIEKYSKKKESVSLSDIEEFYEDFLRDRSQEPTRKVYANEAKKTYDAIVANWHKNDAGNKSKGTMPSKKTDDKKSEKPYIYNDGGMVGGKTQIKDEAGLLKVLNNSKSNTVLIYDKDWKGLNSEAKKIGEKNGWDVTVGVDKDGNISSTGSYIMFKKKKRG